VCDGVGGYGSDCNIAMSRPVSSYRRQTIERYSTRVFFFFFSVAAARLRAAPRPSGRRYRLTAPSSILSPVFSHSQPDTAQQLFHYSHSLSCVLPILTA